MTASKKNVALRTAGFLLVLVLATSCFVGSTFAKYVVSGNGSDTARVAKFGVTVSGESALFATKYEKDDETFLSKFSVVADNASAAEDDTTTGDKVIAPGTKGDMSQFTVSGKPEVAVRVSFEATEFSLEGWTVDEQEYCPLIFKVNNVEYKIEKGTQIETVAQLEEAVKNAIKATTNDYDPNTDLSAAGQKLNVSWEWPFSTGTENDVKDTALGDAAAAGNAATVTLTVSATVTQID